MVTISKKIFIAFSAEMTDGTDLEKCVALYKAIDSDGFSYDNIKIPAITHNSGSDADINLAIATSIENSI